jgi:hypothetical protein
MTIILRIKDITYDDCYNNAYTECERGVKRPHPSQENAYQIFVMSEHDSKWIDGYCPSLQVFLATQCACAEPERTTTTTTTPSISPQLPSHSQKGKKKTWFSKSIQKVKQQHQQQDGPGQKHAKSPPKFEQGTQEMASPWEAESDGGAVMNEVTECLNHR